MRFMDILFGQSEYKHDVFRLPREMCDAINTCVLIQNKFTQTQAQLINRDTLVRDYIAEGLQRDLIDLYGPQITQMKPKPLPMVRFPDPREVDPGDDGSPIISVGRRQRQRF